MLFHDLHSVERLVAVFEGAFHTRKWIERDRHDVEWSGLMPRAGVVVAEA